MTQKHDITFGDLVHVDGYDDRPFFVDSWTIETHYTPDAEWSEVWFDVTCAWTGEYHMAELDDITRICGADQADDYLLYHARHYEPDIMVIGRELDFKAKPKIFRKPERKPTQRELSSQEVERRKKEQQERADKIDNLLDIRNWNAERYEKTSEMTYRVKIEEIDAELAKLAMTE